MNSDPTGNWPQWLNSVGNWIKKNVFQPVAKFVSDIKEDSKNYNKTNTSVAAVYESNYFSSYKGTLVVRHSNDFLTSWAFGNTIALNHNGDNNSIEYQTKMLNHEYGHILQEEELGTLKYTAAVMVPSMTVNLLSRKNQTLFENYYNMPWEYNADVRGGVSREEHELWASPLSKLYFICWGE